MISRSTLIVVVTIAIHVAVSWLICFITGVGKVSKAFEVSLALGELSLPAMLVGLRGGVPILVRVMLVVLCLEAASYQVENRIYFVLVLFVFQVMILALGWSWCTGWRLAPSSEPAIESGPRTRFSLLQLLTTMTAIAVALAAMRIRLGEVGILKSGQWHEWLLISNVAISSFLLTCGTFASRRTTFKNIAVAAIVCIATAFALSQTRSGGWLFGVVMLVSTISPQLPAIALRLCGWRWVRNKSVERDDVDPPETVVAIEPQDVKSPGWGGIS